MKFVSLVLKCIIKSFRIIDDIVSAVGFKVVLITNRVEHKNISCHGLPYFHVVPGGKCVLGDNLIMNSGVRFSPIGFSSPCTIVVRKDAALIVGNNVGMSHVAIYCHQSIEIGDNVKQ